MLRDGALCKLRSVIDTWLTGQDWTEPPECMAFQTSYRNVLGEIGVLIGSLLSAVPGEPNRHTEERAAELYVRIPAIVNVMLNYKICIEHALPLHPTVYYELKEARRYRMDHSLADIEGANRLFRESINLARSAIRLDPGWQSKADFFLSKLKAELSGFVYSGIKDNYTWRGSDPDKLHSLADKVSADFAPDLVIAAAHGSIMPALLFSEILQKDLYFIRFSMFKRRDEEPIVSFSDEAWLLGYADKRVLLFDEDVAGGTTLSKFSDRLSPLFAEVRTGCVIRHAGAEFRPDYTAKVWWD